MNLGYHSKILTKIDQEHTFKISPEEAKTIANAFKTGDFNTFKQNGIIIEDINYIFVNSVEDEIVFGKKEDLGTLTMHKSTTKIIIGFTQEAYQQSGTNIALKNIVRYFLKISL